MELNTSYFQMSVLDSFPFFMDLCFHLQLWPALAFLFSSIIVPSTAITSFLQSFSDQFSTSSFPLEYDILSWVPELSVPSTNVY